MIGISCARFDLDGMPERKSGFGRRLALNHLMLDARNPDTRVDIVETWEWHRDNLPLCHRTRQPA
jgi:hypothetical protein